MAKHNQDIVNIATELNVQGNLKLSETTVDATAAEINAVSDVSARNITLDATTLTITQAVHGERIVLLAHTAATSTVTLPAATGTGSIYNFIVIAANTNNNIIKVANASDAVFGAAYMTDDSAANMVGFAAQSGDDTVTLNGTTTGGVVGDSVRFIDYGTNTWSVRVLAQGSSTEATPFSATVS